MDGEDLQNIIIYSNTYNWTRYGFEVYENRALIYNLGRRNLDKKLRNWHHAFYLQPILSVV